MSQAFVSYQRSATEDRLQSLLQTRSSVYYFLRYVHCVRGFCDRLPKSTLSPEGQMFDGSVELRWKQKGNTYDLLWLGHEPPPEGFEVMDGDWQTRDRNAKVYPPNETRLPKGIQKPPDNLDIRQRYFYDRHTEIVHFIALTVK